jgi:intein/homing endonuclease
MKKRIKTIAVGTAALTVLILTLWLLQCLLVPKYMSEIPEGALIAEYYRDEGPHDVIFVGDCEVYENFSPITLWEKYGITSYIRGSAQQLIWQSYYLLEEMFKYENPEVVVFNVLSMKYGTPQSEAYNRLNIDGMRLSLEKLKCIKASMTEGESFISYIFPILRYHTRWDELTADDYEYMFRRDTVGHSGYLMQKGVRGVSDVPVGIQLEDYAFADICWQYLDMMRELCESHGTELILIKAPSLYPYWYEEWDNQIITYAKNNNLKYYNFLKLCADIGIDWNTDTYDMGLHLNVWGAEKLSGYFGKILSEAGVTDRRGEAEAERVWASKTAAYYNEKEGIKND